MQYISKKICFFLRIKFTDFQISVLYRKVLFIRGKAPHANRPIFLNMSIIDRYVLAEWAKVFIAAIAVTLGILILHNMYDDLGEMLNLGASVWTILHYYWLYMPIFVPVVLPISLLISVIFVLGNFHKNSEITAMRASGMSVFRITRALWFMGLVLSLFLFWINSHLVPTSMEKSKQLFADMRASSQNLSAAARANLDGISLLCFNNRVDSRMWFINHYNSANGEASGVEIHNIAPNGYESSKILARLGKFDELQKCWVFTDGQEVSFDENTGRQTSASVFDTRTYTNYRENPEIMKLSMSRAKDLSLFELQKLLKASGDSSSEAMRPYAVMLASKWASPFACLIVVAIAIPFSIAGVRTNPMVGVSKTAGLFFAYYVLDSIFGALGSNGTLPITLAAWIPNVGMMLFALSLYRKDI